MATTSASSPSASRQEGLVNSPESSQTVKHQDGENIGDGDLTGSLRRLTISSTSPTAKQPRSPRPPPITLDVDNHLTKSSTPRRPSSSLRSPFPNVPSPSSTGRSPSRAGTPALLKKASLNSLHSAHSVTPLRRASSSSVLSQTNSRAARSPLRSISPEPPQSPLPTAHSLAKGYFEAELEAHQTMASANTPTTTVILQDDCYGHRYSRPKTSKRDLLNIVERPERLKACVLGVSTAYVRLGGRHEGGAFPIKQDSGLGAQPSMPFHIKKSERRISLLSETVTNVHGTKWMEELVTMCNAAEEKLAANGRELQRPEMDRGPDSEEPRRFHEGDLYLCSESLDAMEGAMGGVCDAVDSVFQTEGPKRAFVAIRPPGHHCSASYPSGFCWVNNVHVGIMHAAMTHGLTHAVIIDFDLHHGDGSQEIAWQHNARRTALLNSTKHKNAPSWKKTSIGYFSLHDINSFPCEYGDAEKVRNASVCIDNAHGQTVWNIHLEAWETEAEFWDLYETKYLNLLEKTRIYLRRHTADLRSKGINANGAIFISAGFDASEHEDEHMRRHKVNVPTEFYARLTRDIAKIAEEAETGVEGKIISVLEGGYSDRTLCSGVLSHICGLTTDGPIQAKDGMDDVSGLRYDPSWWSRDELAALELAHNSPPVEIKRPRNVTPPTYSSPTHASAARAVAPPKLIRRSVSGLTGAVSNGYGQFRPPTPPPPEVPWMIAAVELSKLLIPTGRTTVSCTSEDLKAEATRARLERQLALNQDRPTTAASVAPVVVVERAPTRMSLRERKVKSYVEEPDSKSRRQTVGAAAVITTDKNPKQSRRLSATSTISSETQDPTPPPPIPQQPVPANLVAPQPHVPLTRPGSAMGAKNDNGSIVVKKTRAPAKKKEPPVPKVSKTPKAEPVASQVSTNSQDSTTVKSEADSSKGNSPRMDALTRGVNKIKITIVSKAQREERERERARAEAAKSIAVVSPTDSQSTKPSASSPIDAIGDTTLVPPSLSPTSSLGASIRPSSPMLSPTDTGFSISTPSTPMPKQGDKLLFKHYRGPDGAVSEALKRFEPQYPQQQVPLTWVEPNRDVPGTPVSGPTPMRREDLPVFGSTGVIPFSPGNGGVGVGQPSQAEEKSENPQS